MSALEYLNKNKTLHFFFSSVQRSYDRVSLSENGGITLKQCSQQLLSLGYGKDLISCDSLKRILSLVRDVLANRDQHELSPNDCLESSQSPERNLDSPLITREEFSVITSYLSTLQQEIEENCCVSPIKGTNLPPPPIFLTNSPGKFRVSCKKILSYSNTSIFFFAEVLNQYSKQCSQTEEIEYVCHHSSSSSSLLQSL